MPQQSYYADKRNNQLPSNPFETIGRLLRTGNSEPTDIVLPEDGNVIKLPSHPDSPDLSGASVPAIELPDSRGPGYVQGDGLPADESVPVAAHSVAPTSVLPSHDLTLGPSSLHSLLSGGGMSDSLQLSSLRGERMHELEQRAPDTVMGGGKSAGSLLQMLKGEQAADPDTGDEAHADVRYNEAIPVQQRANEIQKIGEPARVAGDARLAEEKVKGANELALGAQHDKSSENVAHINAQGRIDTAAAKPEAQPAAVRQQQYDARNVQAHVAGIRQEMENLAAHGVLGPVGGRWSEYMAGTVGSSQFTNDPEVARQLSKFRDDISLLKSGMARVHGGARGAGSPEMAKRFDNLLNSKSMDATLLNGSLDSFDDWLETYAKPGGAGPKPTAAPASAGLPPGVTVRRVQ